MSETAKTRADVASTASPAASVLRILGLVGVLAVLAFTVTPSKVDLPHGGGGADVNITDSYAMRIADRHDCWNSTSGRHDIPNAAVVTLQNDVKARYITNPRLVDQAFRVALGASIPRIYSVTALCLKEHHG